MSIDRKNRGKRVPKRKFHGNRYTKRETEACFDLESDRDTSTLFSDSDCRNVDSVGQVDTPQIATPTFTVSEKKIHDFYDIPKVSDSEESDDSCAEHSDTRGSEEKTAVFDVEKGPHGNRIIDVGILSAKVSASTVCRFCGGEIDMIELERKGLASEFAFQCRNKRCNDQTSFHSCEEIAVGNLSVSSINRRSVIAIRCIGGDHSELETFCAMMDLPTPVQEKSVNIINKNTIEKACSTVQKASCKKAAEIEYQLAPNTEDDQCRDIDVSCDGSWMTPGHSSKELQKRLHREVGATLPEQNEAELSQLKPMKQSLEDDLKEAAAAVNLSQYAIKGSDSDWAQALPENTAITNIVSIKGLSKAKRKLENGAEAADTDSFKRKDKKMRTDKKTKKKGGR